MSWGYGLHDVIMFLAVIIFFVAVYTVIPDLFLHRLGIGAWKRQYTPGVAITFDDGPDPVYTPQILDVLARHQVSAAFFVIGEKAAKYPELVKMIIERGHKIGAHSQHHRYGWFMSPWKTWRDWEECLTTLERLTGEVVEWVRPPWGTFNLITWCWIKIRRKQAVLWNVEGRDWLAGRSPEEIATSVLLRVNEGSIIVLHDAGGEPNAPANTIKALDIICRNIVEDQKLPLAALEFPRWPGRRRLAFWLMEKWEHLFARIYNIERISSTNALRLSKTRYSGPDLYDADGCLLAKSGDYVGELHLDNVRWLGTETDIQKIALRGLRMTRDSLPALTLYAAENPDYEGIQVFLGLTLLYRGVKGLGFHIQDLPVNWHNRLVGFMQKFVMWFYGPGIKKTGKSRQTRLKLIWISRQQLMETWMPIERKSLL